MEELKDKKDYDTKPHPTEPDKLPEDNRDQGNSTEDWNAEQNESGRRK